MSLRIQIQSTPALLGMDSKPAALDIRQKKADQELSAPLPRVQMESRLPKVQIDQSQCFSESGLKGSSELTTDNANYAIQKMYESIGRIADQGTQLSNIHEPDDKIVSQAYYNAYDQFDRDYNMVTMPRSRPKISVIEGKVDLSVVGGNVEHQVRINKPEIGYQAGKLDIYLRQKNNIIISTKESQGALDIYV